MKDCHQENLQIAFDAQTKWRMVSDPNQLTKDAVAIKASGTIKAESVSLEASGWK